MAETSREHWLEQLVRATLGGVLPVVLIVAALAAGAVALLLTPREEEPQIVVPMADVMVEVPGFSAAQVERQVATPLEKLLYQIDGVEHVYSMSRDGQAVVTARFYVGEDREDSLVKVYNKLYSNTDHIPSAVRGWVVKPVEVDDVPILSIALWSDVPHQVSDFELRRLAEELANRLQAIHNTNQVRVFGGRPREWRVELDVRALAARATSPLAVAQALGLTNIELPAGGMQRRNQHLDLRAGRLFTSTEDLRSAVVNVVDGVPVYLGDVARVVDGPAEPSAHTWMRFGAADPLAARASERFPSVTLSVAKQKGSNAVWVADDVEALMREMRTELFPVGVDYRITRNYGDTANEKIDNLVSGLFVAVLTVVVFIGIFLGWRAALVVALAVPVCYGVMLGLDLLAGYTINRVTLFALILALGLLVDDPIAGVDNIERYLRQGTLEAADAVVRAMGEIRSALIMSTVAIILSFVPLFFITGMMGPYMAPMAFNVPLTVSISTLVAFIITPWLAHKLLGGSAAAARAGARPAAPAGAGLYRRLLGPLLQTRTRAWLFLGLVGVLFVGAALLPMLRMVPLKLLPFDNKNELQLVIDMPEGTTLEHTAAVADAFADFLVRVPEVREVGGFIGVPSPMDFNAMVRHYYLRADPHTADLRITLAHRLERAQSSHALGLRIRPQLEAIAAARGARIELVEVPPGPPVIATVVVELYGQPQTPYAVLRGAARTTAARLAREPFVVDVDSSDNHPSGRLTFVPDAEKAALSGVSTDNVAATLTLANEGRIAGYAGLEQEVNALPIRLRLPYEERGSASALGEILVAGQPGVVKLRDKRGVRDAPTPLVALSEIGSFQTSEIGAVIYHKDLRPVAYAYANIAGRAPAEVVYDVAADLGAPASDASPRPLGERTFFDSGGGDGWQLPAGVEARWNGEGEWDITLRVFRDLGIAFGAALVGIFIVLRVQTGSGVLTGIIMMAIPLTVIGIMPGFWLLNQLGERSVAGYPDPVLFTATAMIGMIALSGIAVRNSLILVEFTRTRQGSGASVREALLDAGATRMRPVFLTAGTTLLGNLIITLDPVFSGLAWAIIFGIVASTAFTLLVVPTVYALVFDGIGEPAARGESS